MPLSGILFTAAALLIGLSLVILGSEQVWKEKVPVYVKEGKRLVFALGVICALAASVIRVINDYHVQ